MFTRGGQKMGFEELLVTKCSFFSEKDKGQFSNKILKYNGDSWICLTDILKFFIFRKVVVPLP